MKCFERIPLKSLNHIDRKTSFSINNDNQLTVMCTTRGEHRLISIRYQGSGTVRSKTSSSGDDSSGTFRSKFRTGLFAPKEWDDSPQNKFTGRFTHFHNISPEHVYSLKIKFGDTISFLEQ